MNQFVERWKHAFAIEMGRAKPTPPIEKEIPSLQEWGLGPEGGAAMSLLDVTRQEIVIAHSEPFMSRTIAVVLKPKGLCRQSGVVGEAAAYTKEKSVEEIIPVEDAVRMAIEYNDEIECEQDIVVFLRERLDEIAEEVNRKARKRMRREALA